MSKIVSQIKNNIFNTYPVKVGVFFNPKIQMKVAFDLDNTLIVSHFSFPVELPKRRFWAYFCKYEPLRAGTVALFDFCKQQGWEIWIYTTSFRSVSYIKRLFWLYGIGLNGVVNQEIHNKKANANSSKYPPSFGIDVIVDDSEGVKIEGKKYNFNAIWIQPDNINWVADIKSQLLSLLV